MVAIITTWFLCSLAVVAAGGWLCYVIMTWGRPRKPEPPRPAPPEDRPPAPPVKTSPMYRTRWGYYRRHGVEADKADWLRQFEQLSR